jgi:hypothetical protein
MPNKGRTETKGAGQPQTRKDEQPSGGRVQQPPKPTTNTPRPTPKKN